MSTAPQQVVELPADDPLRARPERPHGRPADHG